MKIPTYLNDARSFLLSLLHYILGICIIGFISRG